MIVPVSLREQSYFSCFINLYTAFSTDLFNAASCPSYRIPYSLFYDLKSSTIPLGTFYRRWKAGARGLGPKLAALK